MTDDHAAFLRAIVENPRDLLVRLVYADFLEETGDPNHVARAHLIRAQVALDDPATDPDEYDGLKAFEGRLLDLFREDWDRELPLWLAEEGEPAYRRGFVEHVSLRFHRFTAMAAAVFAAVPLRSLHLRNPVALGTDPLGLFGLFDRVPGLAAVDTLKLGPSLSYFADFGPPDAGHEPPLLFEQLMTCRTLTGLRTLDVSTNPVTDAWLIAFVSALPAAAFAGTLEVLNFTDCVHITNAGGNTLATARSLHALRRLVLKDVPLNAATRSMLRRTFGDRVSF